MAKHTLTPKHLKAINSVLKTVPRPLRQDSPVSELIKKNKEEMETPDKFTQTLECITWENPFVWLTMPFWIPLALVIYTSFLLILWSLPGSNYQRKLEGERLQELDNEDEDEDEEDKLADMFDLAAKYLLLRC